MQSRRDNNLAQRFPEILAAARGLGDLVLDGELVALRDGRLDFGALASPPRARAAAGVTIYYVTFDLIAEDDRDWRPQRYRARRLRLEQLLAGIEPPLQLNPATTDQDQAMPWLNPAMAYRGIEGILVKDRDKPYRAGRTGDWRKIRSVRGRHDLAVRALAFAQFEHSIVEVLSCATGVGHGERGIVKTCGWAVAA